VQLPHDSGADWSSYCDALPYPGDVATLLAQQVPDGTARWGGSGL